MCKYKIKEKNKEFQEIFGVHAVRAALENPKRKNFELNIIKKHSDFSLKYSKKVQNIRVYENKEFYKKFGNENVNQGMVLKCKELISINFEKFIISENSKKNSIILILDQIQDPQNIGSIIRSCSLFDCRGIIVSKNHSPNITSTIIKSASGAVEVVDYIKVTNLNRSIKFLKKNGYWVFGLDNSKEKKKMVDVISPKTVFVLGSEGRGLRNLIKKECDDVIALPFKPNDNYKIDSLNVSNAASIALYEFFKKFN